jgi:hypothetical protein
MLTNIKGLPNTFVKALSREYHKGADYSASQLTKPVRMVHLEKRHRHEVTEDITERIWSLFGSAVHAVLESGETENQLAESYMVEEIAGVKLSGIADLYEDGIIYDYKTTSAWSYVFRDDKMHDWISQLNTYAWLFNKTGFDVKGLKIVMILRDWQASKAKFDPNYPDCQVQVVDIPLKPLELTELYIKRRIKRYEYYKNTPDNDLPLCTEHDRWAKPPKYATMKKGRKSAVKLFDDLESAESFIADTGKAEYVEERKGELWKRCEYCSGSAFCNQYKEQING